MNELNNSYNNSYNSNTALKHTHKRTHFRFVAVVLIVLLLFRSRLFLIAYIDDV